MSRRFPITVLAAAAAACAAVSTAGADGGPAPGFAGGAGVATRDGRIHYVAVSAGSGTVIEAIDRRGVVLLSNWLPGGFGIPLVATDGTPGGLTRDGRRLVLSSYSTGPITEFAIVQTRTLQVGKSIQLKGTWSFDALSPDGRTIYLIQYFLNTSSQRYLVRAYDVAAGRLYKRPITARTETGRMTGWPVTRAASQDGRWVYTLYQRSNGSAFVHALDTMHRSAVCIDLPRVGRTSSWSSMGISSDGRKLLLGLLDSKGFVADIDLRSFRVKMLS